MPTLSIRRTVLSLAAAWAVAAGTATAQDTREGIIASQEADKAANPPAEVKSKPEQVLDRLSTFFTPKSHGPFPYLDSPYGGAGFTLGAGYGWTFGDAGVYYVRGLYSVKNYKLIEFTTLSPGHLNDRLSLEGTVGWRQATEASFFGLGMGSTAENHSNFDFKETYMQGDAELRPLPWWIVDGGAALESYIIGPGAGDEPSTEDVYTPTTLPGVGTDPTYIHSHATLAFDSRPAVDYARTGGYYGATLHDYRNTNGAFDFDRVDGEAIQLIPVLRETWVVALHGKVETTLGSDVNDTPYFLLPSLGSSSTLRGYRSWRFRDRNMLLTQAEFRWIPNRLGMDMAFFFDAGKVTPRWQDLSLTGMAHDWGVGIRLHGPTRTPVRVELARGSEGLHMVFSGSAVF